MHTWIVSIQKALDRSIADRESVLLSGLPGTGKTTALKVLFEDSLRTSTERWAPGLFLTPDRRRAALIETEISGELLGAVASPGGHRLVRSIASYAHLVVLEYLTLTDPGAGRPTLMKGAEEDAWLADWIAEHKEHWLGLVEGPVLETEWFRTELRNIIACAERLGLTPTDLEQAAILTGTQIWWPVSQAYRGLAGSDPFAPGAPNLSAARIERVAARALRQWPNDAPPVPALLVLDDVQDCMDSAVDLLVAVQEAGAQLVVTSSPLSATASFRGANAELGTVLARQCALTEIELEQVWRGSDAARTVAVGAESLLTGTPQAGPDLPTAIRVVSSDGRQALAVANDIRRRHLLEGVDWADHAVIVRRAADVDPLRRVLARQRVPLAPRERPVVLAQIPVCQTIFRLLATEIEQLPADFGLWLLTSPLVGGDQIAVHRLLRDAKSQVGADAGALHYWLFHAVPAALEQQHPDAALSLTIARKMLIAAQEHKTATARRGMWAVWCESGKAQQWKRSALNGGVAGEAADERLDAVVSAFRAADLWEQEMLAKGRPATAEAFALSQLTQDVETDSIANLGLRGASVEVLTVAQAAGRQWSHVYLVGLQDGSWPAVGSPAGILEQQRLETLVQNLIHTGWTSGETPQGFLDADTAKSSATFADQRRDHLDSELRLLVSAASRATVQTHVIAVDNSEQALSPFLIALRAGGFVSWPVDNEMQPVPEDPSVAFELSSMIALLRRQAMHGQSEEERAVAVKALGYLALQGVADADPDLWADAQLLSSNDKVQDGPIHLSPSKVETARDCLLRWFFGSLGAGRVQGLFATTELDGAAIGNLIHEIAEEAPYGSETELLQLLDKKWAAQGFATDTIWNTREYQRAQQMIRLLAEYFKDAPRQVETEVSVQLDLGDAKVFGRIDRLETGDDGKVRIVDIKTGKTNQTAKAVEENLQLRTYQLAVGDEVPIEGAVYLNLGKPPSKGPEMRQAPLTEEQWQTLREELQADAKLMFGPTYSPSIGSCRICHFKAVCPAWEGTND